MNSFSGKSWFVIELYTPTPTEITEDSTYVEGLLSSVEELELSNYVYSEEVSNSMSSIESTQSDYTLDVDNDIYINEEINSTYVNTVEVIHVEQ